MNAEPSLVSAEERAVMARCEFAPGPPLKGAGVHIVLVHGTGARGAPWTRGASPFAQKLQRMHPAGVRFSRFDWSGDNTHAGRVEAANMLRVALQAEVNACPDTPILLIGHSHGGNICQAAASVIPSVLAEGVVTLATPFFHVHKRRTGLFRTVCAALVAYISIQSIACIASLFNRWAAPLRTWLCGTHCQWLRDTSVIKMADVASGVATAAFFLATFWLMGYVLTNRLVDSVKELQNKRYREWSPLRPTQVRTLSIWFWPDEALWGLRALRAVPDLMHRIAYAIHRVIGPIIVISSFIVAGIMTYHRVYDTTPAPSGPKEAGLFGLPAVSLGTLVVAAGILAAWAGSVLPFGALNQFAGDGTMSLWSHFLLNIHIERKPAIDSTLVDSHELPLASHGFWSRVRACFPYPIVHSRVYLDARTARTIRKWYAKRSRTLGP